MKFRDCLLDAGDNNLPGFRYCSAYFTSALVISFLRYSPWNVRPVDPSKPCSEDPIPGLTYLYFVEYNLTCTLYR